MERVQLITNALAYIELHLTQDLKTDDIANYLHCSKSSTEKLFKYVTNMSIKDYCIRRRMTCAAKDIRRNQEVSLLDLAMKYGYGSNEAFTRAFKSVWHVNPSEFRREPFGFDLFPPLRLEQEIMEDDRMSGRKKVDISELYDEIMKRQDCYIVGVDIKKLIPINEIAREAGDLAILTALKRLEAASGEEDIVFRIGGDEFVSLTNSRDEEYAKKIVEEVLSHNNENIYYQDQAIPLMLYATYYSIDGKHAKYAEVFKIMQEKLDDSKM